MLTLALAYQHYLKLDEVASFGWSPATGYVPADDDYDDRDATLRKVLFEQTLHEGPAFVANVIHGRERGSLEDGRHWLESEKSASEPRLHCAIHRFFLWKLRLAPLPNSLLHICEMAFLQAKTLPLGLSEEQIGEIASASV